MWGPNIGALNVTLNSTSSQIVWSKSGTQGAQWTLRKIDVNSTTPYNVSEVKGHEIFTLTEISDSFASFYLHGKISPCQLQDLGFSYAISPHPHARTRWSQQIC